MSVGMYRESEIFQGVFPTGEGFIRRTTSLFTRIISLDRILIGFIDQYVNALGGSNMCFLTISFTITNTSLPIFPAISLSLAFLI